MAIPALLPFGPFILEAETGVLGRLARRLGVVGLSAFSGMEGVVEGGTAEIGGVEAWSTLFRTRRLGLGQKIACAMVNMLNSRDLRMLPDYRCILIIGAS